MRRVLSISETADPIGISRAHTYALVAGGDIPSLRLVRQVVVPLRALVRMIEGDEVRLRSAFEDPVRWMRNRQLITDCAASCLIRR